MRKADLHIHTTCSDGTFSPEEIVKLAVERKLSAIAITDHDTVAGYKPASKAAEGKDLTVITGAEFTADFEGREIHLLAYDFDIDHNGIQELESFQRSLRKERAKAMVTRLQELGLDIKMEQVERFSGDGMIARPHIAAAMKKAGYVNNMRQAFHRYLGNYGPAYVKSEHRSTNEIIQTVHQAGGIVSIAHPGRTINEAQIVKLIDAGVDGIEIIHPSHQYVLQKKFEELADFYDLFKTGGSDFHGRSRMEQVQFGVVAVNPAWVKQIIRSRNVLS